MTRTKPINEQTVVITGASSGIGLATAKLAAQKGARVVLASREASELERCVIEIEQAGGKALAVTTDVTSMEDLEKLRDHAIATFGQIDTWINNAGTGIYGYLMDTPVFEDRSLFETNFWSVVNGSRLAVQAMKASGGGTLINLGSEVSVASVPLQGMYSATKHAIKAFTEALRSELHHQQVPVQVCLVRPAGIDTHFTDHSVNRLREGEPALPDPVYSPEVAAQAIVNCIENPQRDVYVGGAARLFTVIDTLFPHVKDFITEAMMNKIAAGTKEPHRESNEVLHHTADLEGRGGTHKGRAKSTSLYSMATTGGIIKTLASAVSSKVVERMQTRH